MAVANDIGPESSSSEFLTKAKTEELANKFSSGSISKVDGEITQIIKGELAKGLSQKALSIEGRSPLNDIATEIITRLGVTVADIQDLKTITIAKGNGHTNDEANRFITVTINKYRDLCTKVDKALADYKNDSYSKTDSKGESHQVNCSSDITVKYTINATDATKITKSGSKDSDSNFSDTYQKFIDAFETAEKYYDKVDEAIKFYNENGKGRLETPYASIKANPMSNEEHRPDGVQPDAKVDKGRPDEDGNTTDTYYNPDGSTVTIQRDKDGHITDHKVRDRDGFTTETYQYDDEGQLTHKNVWSYKKVDGRDDSVYEGSYTRYEQDENGEWKAVGESQPGCYSYPVKDENGNITIRNDFDATEPPAAGNVADEKREPVHENYKPTTSGTEASDNSGTPSPPTTEYYEGKYKPDGSQDSAVNDYVMEQVGDKEDFVLPKGYKLFADKPWSSDNTVVVAEDRDKYFKYVESEDRYYVLNEDGTYSSNNKSFSREDFMNSKGRYGDFYTNESGIVSADDTRYKS